MTKEIIDQANAIVKHCEVEYLAMLRNEINTLKACGCHHCLVEVPFWEERYQSEVDRLSGTTPEQKQKPAPKEDPPPKKITLPDEYVAVTLDELIGRDDDPKQYIEGLDIKDTWVLFSYNTFNFWVYYDENGSHHYFDQNGNDLLPLS